MYIRPNAHHLNLLSSSPSAFLHIFSLILCTFFMLCEIPCIKNDKILFSLLYFAKNSVGRVGALNLDNVFKYTLFFGRYP